jgi:hypothetical protein
LSLLHLRHHGGLASQTLCELSGDTQWGSMGDLLTISRRKLLTLHGNVLARLFRGKRCWQCSRMRTAPTS